MFNASAVPNDFPLQSQLADLMVLKTLLESKTYRILVVIQRIHPDDGTGLFQHFIQAAAGDLHFEHVAWMHFDIRHQAQARLRYIPNHIRDGRATRAALTTIDPQPTPGSLSNGTAAI